MSHRLALLADYEEEGWTSMNFCAEMLIRHLESQGMIRPTRVGPAFRRRAQRIPIPRHRGALFNADRLFNRFWDYPRAARGLKDKFDYFHICDHSYAQLAHELPAGRTGVYCHDLHAFRCLLDPGAEPRPFWFRSMMRRVLGGLSRAAVVFCATQTMKRQIVEAGIAGPGRVVLAPYGVAEEFRPDPGDQDATLPLPFGRDVPFILHVGSMVPRKRIDVLLDTFALVRSRIEGVRLVQVGGPWKGEHDARIARLGIADAVTQLRGLGRATLAALYRQASVVLIPSEAEGFGLPMIEALACGAAVVASDIPALREAGGPAAAYRTVGDLAGWADAVVTALTDPAAAPPHAERLAWAARFSWAAHAETIARAYDRLP